MIGCHMSTGEEMDQTQIANMAIDSLMSIEIRSWFRWSLGLEIKTLRAKYRPQSEVGIKKGQDYPDFW